MITRRLCGTASRALFGIAACFCLFALLSACQAKSTEELVIYAYDSFTSEWGPGPAVIPEFERKTGLKVSLYGIGDAGQTLARVIAEKNRPKADIIIGIDNHLAAKAISAGVLEAYRPADYRLVPEHLVLDSKWHLTPFDYSTFAIMWDSAALAVPPRSLEELTSPDFRDKIILMDPRTSTPGLGFAAWTKAVYGTEVAAYWKRLAPNILSMTPGWSTGYGLFTKGEAPLVISYTTSAAYHAEYEEAGRYRALEFPEGHPMQIEGIGIVKGAKNRKNAEMFIDFALSEDFQKQIPLTNWMYPVLPGIELPESYQASPVPQRTYLVDPAMLESIDAVVLEALNSGS